MAGLRRTAAVSLCALLTACERAGGVGQPVPAHWTGDRVCALRAEALRGCSCCSALHCKG